MNAQIFFVFCKTEGEMKSKERNKKEKIHESKIGSEVFDWLKKWEKEGKDNKNG